MNRSALAATLLGLLVPALLCGPAAALELGYEGYAALIASDNVGGANAPDEEEGLIGAGVLALYGERRGRRLRAAFTAELDARRRLDDEDDDIGTVSRLLGAAEVRLSPRSLRWYVGDVLGGVRVDDAIQPISDNADAIARRNVFVTGPVLEHEIDGRSRLRARLLYVNQREEGEELESLYNGSLAWERDTTPGSYFGLSVSDIYTDAPDERARGRDFNRVGASAYWNRRRGLVTLYGELGATRYDTDEESLDGLRAELSATRELSARSSVVATLARDLSDQTLTTVESLIADGSGERPEADGFFDETRLELAYALESRRLEADLGIGVAERDYRLLAGDDDVRADADGEDRVQGFAFATLSRELAPRWRGELGASYERQRHDEREDRTESVLASALLRYRIGTSLELEAAYLVDRAQGERTRVRDGRAVLEEVDVTENRVRLGLRWAPPSRASREMTVELKSLLR